MISTPNDHANEFRCRHCGLTIFASEYYADKWYDSEGGVYRCNDRWRNGQYHQPIDKSKNFKSLYEKLCE